MYKSKGFTLIELLVVIAIIGILSSVVMASLNSARQKARDARRVSDLKQLQLALEMYYDDNSGYPVYATYAALIASGTNGVLVDGGYLAVMPDDPLTSQDYGYVGTASTYCLSTLTEGTAPSGTAACTPEVAAHNFRIEP